MKIFLIFQLLFFSYINSQEQEDILKDLDLQDNLYVQTEKNIPLKLLYIDLKKIFEEEKDSLVIQKSESILNMFNDHKFKKAELTEDEFYYLKIRKLRAESYFNLRNFVDALKDSKFIFENFPNLNVFDYTRYSTSLFYNKQKIKAFEVLNQGKSKFRNENDLKILLKTENFLKSIN